MSLPYLFNTTLETIPPQIPNLDVDSTLKESWAKQLNSNKFKVGLVWEGNPDQQDNENRSCKLENYLPLSVIPGVALYSLQLGDAAEQVKHPPDGMEIVDLTDHLTDMADTAALIRNLDLVITIDTSVAHLAGALGHPVWVILWTGCCWRYMDDRDDNVWYPSMRVFRQKSKDDWSIPIAQVAQKLKDQIKQFQS